MATAQLGHIKPEFLNSYRYWAQRRREAERLAGLMSGQGRYDLANAMFRVVEVLKEKCNTFRVDLADTVEDYVHHIAEGDVE